LHHVVLDRWSQGSSPLHRRDPRVKTVAVLGFLIVVASARPITVAATVGYLGILLATALVAGLPLAGFLVRGCVVLPFSGTFALLSFLAGDAQRALEVLTKSYLSALAVLVLVGTTPLPRLLGGLQRMGAPAMIVFVIHLVHRYLFVISEQAQHMRLAARCRGRRFHWRAGFRAAAGTVAVLFGKSYQRAEAVHQAMLARGF